MSVADTRLYDLLGVSPSASVAEIKKAYKRQALRHHPDKGGDANKFQELTAAHDILTNDEKRRMYDQYGEDGVRHAAQGPDDRRARSGSPGDIFDLLGGLSSIFRDRFGGQARQGMFGGNFFPDGYAGQARQPSWDSGKPQNLSYELTLTLEDAFKGVSRKLAVRHSAVCERCDGTGFQDPSAIRTCARCKGAGILTSEMPLGSRGIHVVRSVCPACGGQGRHLPPEARCGHCRGSGSHQTQQVVEVSVPAGVQRGSRLRVAGAGNQTRGRLPGDLVVLVDVLEHDRFERHGDDLALSARVSLADAVGGCEFVLEHLDGQRLTLRTQPGDVIKPGSWWRVRGEGMPRVASRGGAARGDLLVQFHVDFPDRLDAATAERLASSLGPARSRRGAADGGAPRPAERRELERDLERVPFPRGARGGAAASAGTAGQARARL